MTIREQIQELNRTFSELHERFSRIEEKGRLLERENDAKAESLREKWTHRRARIQEQREDVEKFLRIARDHSRECLTVSGASPLPPDLRELNALSMQINLNSRDDPVADRIIRLACAYLAYLEAVCAKLDIAERADLDICLKERRSQIASIGQEKQDTLSSCQAYLKGEEIRNLVSLFRRIHEDYEITETFLQTWDASPSPKRMMLIGYKKEPLDAPKVLFSDLKATLGVHFDESDRTVEYPCGFSMGHRELLFVECAERNETVVKSGVQAMLLNFFRYSPLNAYKVTLLDSIHYNADMLGPLYALAVVPNGMIEAPPPDKDELRKRVRLLAERYRKTETKLGAESVYDYNRRHSPEKRIPLRILILHRIKEEFPGAEEPEMSYLLNNAEKLGITVLRITRCPDKNADEPRTMPRCPGVKDTIYISYDDADAFYVNDDGQWKPFRWLESAPVLPPDFLNKVAQAIAPIDMGTRYFDRFPIHIPERSHGRRKPISVPFALDDEGVPVYCEFENENFAAYIMGAAGSGKSVLLHAIIAGLLMNYHPDEAELWLADFNMTEFRRYMNLPAPHIRYILLEKSEDLVFDLVNKLNERMYERMRLFAERSWNSLADVPPEECVPAIFVIIDEFAQMSQILRETRGTYDDYAEKLENLLAQGRKFGLKFIFASQTYSVGVSGLTDTARKQIQMRFALKNAPDEIRDTLSLSSEEITPELGHWISAPPVYETLFKRRNGNAVTVSRLRNLNVEKQDSQAVLKLLRQTFFAVSSLPHNSADDCQYADKHPVMVDGERPKTFQSQGALRRAYEASLTSADFNSGDTLIYPGAPCSFNPVKPFFLGHGTAENILLAGGGRDSAVSVLLSVLESYGRDGQEIELWASERSPLFRGYRNAAFSPYRQITDAEKLCVAVAELKKSVLRRDASEKLIVCIGYAYLAEDFEILCDGAEEPKTSTPPENQFPDMSEILRKVRECDDPEEKRRIIQEYNERQAASQSDAANLAALPAIYDAREDVQWLLKRAPNGGTHFLFCFEQPADFIALKLSERLFRHKLLSRMSRDDSFALIGNYRAANLDSGAVGGKSPTFLYSDGKETFTFRPFFHPSVPFNGWEADSNGNPVRRR